MVRTGMGMDATSLKRIKAVAESCHRPVSDVIHFLFADVVLPELKARCPKSDEGVSEFDGQLKRVARLIIQPLGVRRDGGCPMAVLRIIGYIFIAIGLIACVTIIGIPLGVGSMIIGLIFVLVGKKRQPIIVQVNHGDPKQ